jgi:hypothetical protein
MPRREHNWAVIGTEGCQYQLAVIGTEGCQYQLAVKAAMTLRPVAEGGGDRPYGIPCETTTTIMP